QPIPRARFFIHGGDMVRSIILAPMIMLAASLAAGQPTQPATELAQIVGTWEGTLTNRGQQYPITLTIRDDGTWASVVPGVPTGPNFSGTVRVDSGKFRYRTKENGIEGTYTLREGDGKRALELLNDPRTTSARMTPKQ